MVHDNALLGLPTVLWSNVWGERPVLGMMVCKLLRDQLCHGTVTLSYSGKPVDKDGLTRGLRRLRHGRVHLKWEDGGCDFLVDALENSGVTSALKTLSVSEEGWEQRGEQSAYFYEAGVGGLARTLRKCKALAHLDLAHVFLGPDKPAPGGAGLLAEALGALPCLTRLALYDNDLDSAEFAKLAAVLGQCTLSQFCLSCNRIGDEGAGTLAGVLGECTALSHLELHLCGIGTSDPPLGVPPGNWGEGTKKLMGALGECKALTHLTLSDNELIAAEVGDLAAVLGPCTSLTHLDLSGNRALGIAGAQIISGVLASGGCTSLTRLDMSRIPMGAAGAEILLEQGRALVELNLSFTHMRMPSPKVLRALSQCTSLTHLDVGGNWDDWDQAREAVELLVEALGNCKGLTRLHLSCSRIQGTERLVELLGECKALAHLDLSLNMLGVDGGWNLPEMFSQLQVLSHLDLSGNRLGGVDSACFLTAGLSGAGALTCLNLSGNQIGGWEGVLLSRLFSECKALACLDLSSNNLGNAGARSIVGGAIATGTTALVNLDLRRNGIDEHEAKLLGSMLKVGMKKPLEHLDLSESW